MPSIKAFRPYDLILKKRNGHALTTAEIHWFIGEYSAGRIPDYQMSAFLMAVYFQGMGDDETTALTEAIVQSGEQLDLSSVPGIKVDKHSTGGVGDKTTLILVPLVAACGLPVAKMSGRGLGHTGGTIDKLESIPGVRTELPLDAFLGQLDSIGAVIGGQTGNLTPADKRLYALRDVTATVDSTPLIAASVMSKKIAAGADAFVLDVKVGRAAFMTDEARARELAQAMIGIARGFGRRAVAWITAMDEPLGRTIGNALEVYEAVDTLKDGGPEDLRELTLTLGTEMLVAGQMTADPSTARDRLERALSSGRAYEKFEEILRAQGADLSSFFQMYQRRAPSHYIRTKVRAQTSGYVCGIDGLAVGFVTMRLGAGRSQADQSIDPHVGVDLYKKTGHRVERDEPLAEVIARDAEAAEEAVRQIGDAFDIRSEPPTAVRPLLGERFETVTTSSDPSYRE